MDDATIRRKLAEFEGYRRRSYIEAGWGIVIKWYDANGDEVLGDEYSPPGQGGLPEYLTDYNAVARVWRVAFGFVPMGEEAAKNLIHPEADGDGEWLSRHTNWIKAFVTVPVRQHALALATAIAKHKEVGK